MSCYFGPTMSLTDRGWSIGQLKFWELSYCPSLHMVNACNRLVPYQNSSRSNTIQFQLVPHIDQLS